MVGIFKIAKGAIIPRRRIQFVPGGYYHIYNRGAGRRSIFRERANYQYILELVNEYLGGLKLTMLAYCLLLNHYHWLVRQDDEFLAGKLSQNVLIATPKRSTMPMVTAARSSKGVTKRSLSITMSTCVICVLTSTLILSGTGL